LTGRDLSGFYDSAYARGGERHARWRELGARGKADHVVELARRAELSTERVAEVGCGDGALLAELSRRGFGGELAGYEISEAALELARDRRIPRLRTLELFDGSKLPVEDAHYDLGVLSHVLEHVPEPLPLLRETARACRAVIVEVPLERNLSGSRVGKRAGSEAIGHVQELDRAAVRELVEAAGLRVEADLLDPLPAAVHTFFAGDVRGRARGLAKAAVRGAVFRASPWLAERTFTLHYCCACLPATSS
jgi:SAM-dependent methyltransferase